MAVDRLYTSTRAVQDSDKHQQWKAYEDVMRLEYPGTEEMVGAQLWGASTFEKRGLHNEVLIHTGLLGSAVKLGRDLRTMPPMADYSTIDYIRADYEIYGIGFEYYEEELGDMLYPEIIMSKVGELPMLLADTEEDEHLAPYNNGETTFTGGLFNTPLFVDGSSNFLQIIGRQGVNYGSNIISNAGGPSYHLISLLEQYGYNFINEEGRISPLKVDRIVCSHRNKKILDGLLGASYNLESGNAAVPNPVDGSIEVIASNRLSNANDMFVFYEGWMDDMKDHEDFRGKPSTGQEGILTEMRTIHIIRSRFSKFFINNRRVLKVKGVS